MVDLRTLYYSIRPWSFNLTYAYIFLAISLAIYKNAFAEPLILPIKIGDLIIDPVLPLLTLAGVILLHGMVNWLNDYYDYLKGIDREGGGSVAYRPHPIISGIFKPNALFVTSIGMGAAATVIGLSLAFLLDRPYILIFGFAGLFLALFYNGPPIAFKYRALGEPATFLGFFLVTAGTYYVMSKSVPTEVLLLSVPPGLLTASVLLINNIRDIAEDTASGAKTLAALLGRKRAAYLLIFMILASYLVVAYLIATGYLPLVAALSLITFIKAIPIIQDVSNAYISLKAGESRPDAPVMMAGLAVQFMALLGALLLASAFIDLPPIM